MVALEGLLLGILQGVLLGSWLPSSIEGLGGTAFAGGVLLVVASAWWLGVPIAVFGALASVSSRPSKPWIGISGTAVAAAAIDWTRAALPGGLPWATLGLSQWPVSGVAQLAVVGGVPLVSGVVAAVNAVIATAWRHRGSEESLRVALGTIGAVAAAAAFGLPVVQWARGGGERGTEVFRLLVVQPVIDPSEHWNPGLQRTQLTYLRELTQRELESAGRGVDAVVWPETSLTAPLDLDAALRSDLDRTVASLGTDLITGVTESALSGPHRYHNSIVWLRADGRRIADFQKTHATPLAEAAPPAAVTGALEVAFGGWMRGVRMEPGRMEGPLRGRFELAPLLCWELAFPRLLAARRSEATVAILNLADDSRLGAGFVSEAQLAAAAFRAIETRLPVVRAAQGGVSAIVDPLGRVRGRIGFGREGSLLARLVAERPPGAAERVVLLALIRHFFG
jgi:apolipoprotein N-acyltransferase